MDILKGKFLLKKGIRFGFKEIVFFLVVGIFEVLVFKKLKVVVISIGNEIILLGEEFKLGKIYDINGRVIIDVVREFGGEVFFFGIVRDDCESLKSLIFEGFECCDVVFFSGGVSGGIRDFMSLIIEEFGRVYIYGIVI